MSEELDDKLFKLLPLSFKKIFLISFPLFFSTVNVKPLKESLKDWFLIVGKNELSVSLLNNCLDLFKAKGVKKVEKIK